jgi:tetratricopeptide (TPR) repeat protein
MPEQSLAVELGITPAEIASLILLGHSLYEQGKLIEARMIFEGIVLLQPENPYSFAVLGGIHQQMNEYESAIESYSKVLEVYSRDTNTLMNRGECYLNLGRLTEAANDFKVAIELDPQGIDPASNRARFLSKATLGALNLVQEKGIEAVRTATRETLTK